MDATQGDIYLVSRFDPSLVVGRPYIYLVVDTVTELIAGFHVGLTAGETAVAACLVHAACDKVAYCASYGIQITHEQWPSRGVAGGIITDKGREFCGQRMDELCIRYGVERESVPSFRPDHKGIVEKTFDLIQQRYKSLLRGKGVIEPDAMERWSTDYRSQAILTLDDYTKILIHIVLYLNGRTLKNYPLTPEMMADQVAPTPANLWNKKEILQGGTNGLVEDVRFNKPAQDGSEYTDEGIYTITVTNRYTNQQTTKIIYVGTNEILKAYVVTGLSLQDIQDQVAAGAVIAEDGTLILLDNTPIGPEQSAPEQSLDTSSVGETTETPNTAQTPSDKVEADGADAIPIVIGVVLVFLVGILIPVFRQKGGQRYLLGRGKISEAYLGTYLKLRFALFWVYCFCGSPPVAGGQFRA